MTTVKTDKTMTDYEIMDHNECMDYLIGLLPILGRDYNLAEIVKNSIYSVYKHKTHDFKPIYVACVMHRCDVTKFSKTTQNHLKAYKMTFDYNGKTFIPTWSLHS